MTGPNRSPVRGSVGNGGDPKFPEAAHSSPAPPPDEDDLDPDDPWADEDEGSGPLLERLDLIRRKYIPLPDEVVYEFLGEEEFVVHSDHPSFRAFLTQNVILVVLIPIVGPLVVYFGLGAIVSWETVIAFVLVSLIIFALALRRIGDRYTSYVITNMRLIKVTGILRRRVASIPWTGMTGLGFSQSAMGRILGYATIKVESANEESGLREFSDVSDPALFHQRLLDMASARNRAAAARQAQNQALTTPGRRKRRQRRRERRATAAAGTGHRPVGRTSARPAPADGGAPATGAGGGPGVGRPRVREGPPGRAVFADLADDQWYDDVEDPWPQDEPVDPSSGSDPEAPWPDEDLTPPEGQPRVTVTEEESTPPPGRTRSGRPRPRPPVTPSTGQPPVRDPATDEAAADQDPPPGEGRPGRGPGSWLRWPGSGSERSAAPPETADESRQAGRSRRRSRRPAQQAPQKPETIVVPRQAPPEPPPSGKPQRGGDGHRRTPPDPATGP